MAFYVPNIHGWKQWMLKEGFDASDPQVKFKSNAAVSIGNDVWIGKNAIIKSGVTIGDGAVIGAGAVVVKDVPAYGVVAGVPAKLIRMRFSETVVERMLLIKWWDYNVFGLQGLDASQPEAALERIESAIQSGQVKRLALRRYGLSGEELKA
jgi:tetrahydrodipicolinate N-succinyltransferase